MASHKNKRSHTCKTNLNVNCTPMYTHVEYGRGPIGDLWSVLLCAQEREDLPLSKQVWSLVHWWEILQYFRKYLRMKEIFWQPKIVGPLTAILIQLLINFYEWYWRSKEYATNNHGLNLGKVEMSPIKTLIFQAQNWAILDKTGQ